MWWFILFCEVIIRCFKLIFEKLYCYKLTDCIMPLYTLFLSFLKVQNNENF